MLDDNHAAPDAHGNASRNDGEGGEQATAAETSARPSEGEAKSGQPDERASEPAAPDAETKPQQSPASDGGLEAEDR